ncbi:MAG: restriction endonuclease subunit S [Candidatus Aenigmarchaeota archaeon]|nr:restriction endonuclease subunit S [Candidatus Aenigmarchaeota archaeon]
MKLKAYSKYKKSGIQWIGDIPEGWSLERFKLRFKSKKGKIPDNLDVTNGEGYLPYLSMEYLRGKEENAQFSNDPTALKVEDHDLLLLWDGSNAGEFISAKKGILSSTMVKLNIQRMNTQYCKYLCSGFEPMLRDLTVGMGIPHVNGDVLGNIQIPIIGIGEQKKATSFLDSKTSQISKTISADKQLIELLKEKRTALINHVVTKGLNPKAKMKDSGIEWIGEVPEGWEVKKIKFIGNIVLGKMLTDKEHDGHIQKPYLRAQNILWEKVDVSDVKEMWFSSGELKRFRLKNNDLLVSEGGEAGRTALWKGEIDECYIQNSVQKVTLDEGCIPNYFLYLFESYGKRGIFDSVVSRVSIAHLTREKLKEIICTVPPKQEQAQIAKFLDKATSKIDQTIQKIEAKIELLEEFKKSLIHHVVTGKVDVRCEI